MFKFFRKELFPGFRKKVPMVKRSLRRINKNDLEMLFNWRNHPRVRTNSFDKNELSLADHEEWFNRVLRSNLVNMYILEINGIPVGSIRFDQIDRESAKINYLIDPSQQGRGFGTTILDLGVEKVLKDNLKLKEVYGCVLKENLASIKIFEKLSFEKVFEDTKKIKFTKSRE